MKKTYALLLSAMLLLTGCTDKTESGQTETAEQFTAEAATSDTAEQNTSDGGEAPAGVQSSAAESESAEAPEEDGFTKLEYVFDESLWSVTSEVSTAELEKQFGYDTPVDVTQLEDFKWVLEYMEQLGSEEDRQWIIDSNYSYINFSPIYIGSDRADWLYGGSYYLDTGLMPDSAYYSKLCYIKDGVVTDTIAEFVGDCYIGDPWNWGDDILIPTDTAIYKLERGGDTLIKLVDTEEWCYILDVSDEYIIYSDGESKVKVYYAESGDIFTTGIDNGRVNDGDVFYIRENDIVYVAPPDGMYSFDIASREVSEVELDWDELFKEDDIVTGGKYSAYISDEAVELTDISTGAVKLYSLDEMSMQYGLQSPRLIGIDRDIMYIKDAIKGGYMLLAVDIAEDTAYMFKFQGDGGSHNAPFVLDGRSGRIAYHSYGSRGVAAVIQYLGAEKPEEPQLTPLTITPADGLWGFTAEIREGDIVAQLGYDTPVDVTQMREFNEVLTNLEHMDEENRQRIIEQNYSYLRYSVSHIGTEGADWLYGATYYLSTGSAPAVPYYAKLFYVKDGVITDVIAEFDCAIGQLYYWNEDIIVKTDTAIFSLERGSKELTKLVDTEYYSSVMAIRKDYMMFYDSEQRLKIYYRDSGEIFTTDIHKGLYDGYSFVIIDDVMYFFDHFNTQTYRSFDINTREFLDNDIDEEKIKSIFEVYYVIDNELYWVEPDSDNAEFTVTELATGTKRLYSLKEYGAEYVHCLALDGSMLYLATGWGQRAAVDIETNTAVILDYDGDDYTGLYMHCSYDSFMDTVYFCSTDETAGAVRWVR